MNSAQTREGNRKGTDRVEATRTSGCVAKKLSKPRSDRETNAACEVTSLRRRVLKRDPQSQNVQVEEERFNPSERGGQSEGTHSSTPQELYEVGNPKGLTRSFNRSRKT